MKIIYNYLHFSLKKMLNATLILTLATFLITPAQANVIISAVYDGPLSGGTPKGVELYATADIADLSIYGIGSANNGQGTDDEEFTFPAMNISAGTFIYVTTEADPFMTYFGFAPDFEDGSMAINGDDAVELFMNGNVIDVFGDINVDGSGTSWEYLDGWAYRNDGTGPDGTTFVESNWTYSGVDAFDGCSDNATCGGMMPLGSYSPMMSSTSEFDFTTSGFSVAEGDDANVNVALSVAADCSVDVSLDASSTAPATDFTFMNQTLTFTEGGDLTQTISIATVDNMDTDGERTIVLNLENSGGTCSIGSVSQLTITITDNDFQIVDIADVTGEDADGVATSLGALVQMTGVAYCADFRGGGGYDFGLTDATGAISVFSFDDVDDYVLTEGDELQIVGVINQFRGLTQLMPNQITVLSQGNSLDYVQVDELSEATESMPVSLSGWSVVDPSQIGETGSSFNVDLTNGSNTVLMRIDSDANIPSEAIPTDAPFNLNGISGQFSSSGDAPFLDGYQVRPCDINDIATSTVPAFAAQFSIFPNPVSDQLIIQTDMSDYQIVINDVLGRQVFTQIGNETTNIDMSSLTQGMYFITISLEDVVWSAEKIIKE